MLKKILKVFVVLACIAVVLGIIGLVVLKSVFTDDRVRSYVNNAAKEYVGREVKYDRLSFNFFGITLRNLSISEKPDFSKGTFAAADRFVIKVRLKPLFKKQIRVRVVGIDGLNVKIVRNNNDKYNFDDILQKLNSSQSQAGAPSESKGGAGVDIKNISLGRLYINNSNISFEDLKSGTIIAVKNLNVNVKNMNFAAPFALSSNFIFDFQNPKTTQSFALPIDIKANVDLKEFNFAEATIEVSSFKTKLSDASITAQANVKGFKAPKLSLNMQIDSFDNSVLKQFVKGLPQFRVDKINIRSSINADLEKNSAEILSSDVVIGNSKASVSGSVSWKKDLDYKVKAFVDLDLGTLSNIIPDLIQKYNPQGNIKSDITVTPKYMAASAEVENASFKYDPMFIADSVHANIGMHSLNNIRIASLSGNLNGKYFEGSADYRKAKTAINVNVNLVSDGLILNGYPDLSANGPAGSNPSKESAANQASALPLNLTLRLKTSEIKIPYLHSEKGATLSADLTGITAKLDKISGTANFNVAGGTIENLDKLVQSNNAAKIAFSALSAVKQASSLLGITGLEQQQWNSLRYKSFSGDLSFFIGRMTIKNMSFISQLVSVKLTGTTDFKTERLNMRADVHPGANNPLVINIGGTISNPQSNIDAPSTAVAIFGKDSLIGKIGAMFGGKAE